MELYIDKKYRKSFSSKRKKRKEEFYFGLNLTFSLLLGLIIILFIYYIWTLNVNATKGYNIRDLERTKKDLLLKKESLENQISELESLRNIEKSYDFGEIMEKVENPDYAIIKSDKNYAYLN